MTLPNNKDLLNTLRNGMSEEFKNRVPQSDGTNDKLILDKILNYQPSKNEFITELFNKIGKTMFFNKVFNNPYKILHRGMLEFGQDIESIFKELSEVKGFDEHFTGSTTTEGDLIRGASHNVKVDYITKNVKYKFKDSISDQRLKTAFNNPQGLANMTTSIVNSLYSSVECQEYENIRNLIFEIVEKTGANTERVLTCTDSRSDLAKQIRKMGSLMRFPSTKYNHEGVKTFTNKNELILITTCDVIAELDVYTLAHAFNIDKTDVPYHVIEVTDLPLINGKECYGMLADKDIIQIYDTLKETTTFYNGEQMLTNLFAHLHSTIGECPFAQSVLFTKA